jgi:hypothetical protein
MGRLARADNPDMLRILGEIWLPTTIALLATAGHDNGDTHWAAVMTALLVVPFVWKSFVIRHGRPHIRRAILAGSASAFLIMWSEWMIDGVRRFVQGRHGEEELAGLLVILIPPITLVVVLLGAGVASLAAFLQARFWPAPPDESEPSDLALDGGVGGALVATLVAPFAAIIPLATFQPDGRDPGMNLFTFTAGTWLILVPTGAWIGAQAVRRRRRIVAEPTIRPS